MAPKPIRPIRVEGNVAYVPLTRGYEAIIDAADVPLVDAWNWFAFPHGGTCYARRTEYSGGKISGILLHRVLLAAPADALVDHRDGNGLNNTRANLRIATFAENARNARLRKDNVSGYKGVYLESSSGRWKAGIRIGGKHHSLGYFATPESASAAYRDASARLHGEFGRPE